MSPRARAWLPVIVWCGIIFGLSSIPGSSIPKVSVPQFDKLVHTGLYATLGALAARAIARTWTTVPARVILFGALVASAYGVLDELHQLFTPFRSCDVFDWLADTAGGLLGAWLVATWIRRRGKSGAAV